MNVTHCPAVLVVFAMEGCSACDDFKPRLEREVRRWQQHGFPLVFGDGNPETQYPTPQVPIFLLDAQSSCPEIQALGDRFGVEALPTTILFRRSQLPETFVGAVDDQTIYDMLTKALRA